VKSVIPQKKQCSKEEAELGNRTNPVLEVMLDMSLMILRLTELFLEYVLKCIQKLDVKIEKIHNHH